MRVLADSIATERNFQLDKQYMPALTGIRAIAAYMVCLFHYNPFARFFTEGGWKRLSFAIVNEMHIGVTVFFVLSGFLICYRYYDTNVVISWPWFKRYLLNRVARVYPMYLLVTLVTFCLIEWNPSRYELVPLYAHLPSSERASVFLLNISLWKGFFDDYKFTGIVQGWSLTVEECFYLMAPLFMLLIHRNWWFLVLLPIAMLAVMFGLVGTVGQLHFHGLFEPVNFMFNYTFFGRCLEFFAGISLAVYVHRKRLIQGLERQGGWITLAGTLFFIVCLLSMAYSNIGGNSKDSFVGIFLNNAVLPIGIVMLFYGLLTERTWLRIMLSTKLFDTLGKSSYIFYLIHSGVISIWLRTDVSTNAVLQFLLLNILSILLYKFVESPLHRWLKPN